MNGGSGGNTVNVESTQATTPVTVNAGAGNDTINVGSNPVTPANSTLAGIQGNLTVNGQAGTDTLNINDAGTTTPTTYVVTNNQVRSAERRAGEESRYRWAPYH